ncbi:hypothetical protein Pla110_11100 [Polystyrenella longa]|uniref:Uncharacterized protein n=1 Tax=Polystyrenella longa TaxID=2528007 RepID=A0A518CJK7_9PLAN|nr:hypothetical protein [Polystyrenella longa]QDU79400.1 hypothetical protein Pla110_11100 [Polystyrenella longa]
MSYNHIIEPPLLDSLITDPNNVEVAVCALSWIAEKIEPAISVYKISFRLELTFVQYHGPYPAYLACFEKDSDRWDIETYVSNLIEALLNESSVLELLKFVDKANTNWKKTTLELMKRDRVPEVYQEQYRSLLSNRP